MEVTVVYLTIFPRITGTREEQVALEEGETVNALVSKLVQKHGEEFSRMVGNNRSVMFIRDGNAIKHDTVLENGDKIIISLPVGGG